MCTANEAQNIIDALDARIQNNSVFTAHDITEDVRVAVGKNVNVRHGNTQRVISQAFFDDDNDLSDYSREQIELQSKDGGINPTPFVYYPDGKTAEDHPEAVAKKTVTPVCTVGTVRVPPFAAPTPKKGGQVKAGDDYICNVTAEGRVHIPKEIISKAATNGGTYDISFNGKVLYRTPNADGRIRIASAELDGSDKYRIGVDTSNNTILVEQA